MDKDEEGRPIVTATDNPFLDTRRACAIEFPDGREELSIANLIAQSFNS
jgi:hypothetical protein